MFQGTYIPNFIELAQLEMLKKSGELSVQRRIKKKERRKIHFLDQNRQISESHKIRTKLNFGMRFTASC